MILRPGYITKEMLEEALGKEVCMDPGILAQEAEVSGKKGESGGIEEATGTAATGLRPKAPGMRYKHYAPKADLVLVDGEDAAVIQKINALAGEQRAQGKKVGVIASDETKDAYKADYVVDIGARCDEDAIARHLYRILRDFDDWNVDAIYSESFATPRIGQAIMNRLLKAAGHQVIHV
jgi:L-threonylcarbamoyladenylate synthase